jgi:hypothetical protein
MKNLDICYNLLGTKGSEDRYGQLVINSQEFGKKKLLLLMLRFASPDVSLSFNFRVYRLVQREELMKLIGSRRKERLN